jgi:Helix-turn-helix domain
VEYREAELREVVPSGVPDDDPARFLRELRHLRSEAGLEHAELAARAHYPCDAILAAEAGPALPDLPMLSAYVRGCGGPVTEWEERWRTLNRSPALTLLPTRDAGGSDAAVAGARIGSVSIAADGHDPAIIMAALGRVANGIAAEPSPRSVLTPAAAAPAPERASLFAVDSAPATAPVRDADAAPEAAAELSGPGGTAVSDDAARPGRAPSVVKPASVAGHAPRTQRTGPSKPLIAALVIVVCVLAIALALFA